MDTRTWPAVVWFLWYFWQHCLYLFWFCSICSADSWQQRNRQKDEEQRKTMSHVCYFKHFFYCWSHTWNTSDFLMKCFIITVLHGWLQENYSNFDDYLQISNFTLTHQIFRMINSIYCDNIKHKKAKTNIENSLASSAIENSFTECKTSTDICLTYFQFIFPRPNSTFIKRGMTL